MVAWRYWICLHVFNSMSHERVRYRVQQSKRNSISPRAHVLLIFPLSSYQECSEEIIVRRNQLYLPFVVKYDAYHNSAEGGKRKEGKSESRRQKKQSKAERRNEKVAQLEYDHLQCSQDIHDVHQDILVTEPPRKLHKLGKNKKGKRDEQSEVIVPKRSFFRFQPPPIDQIKVSAHKPIFFPRPCCSIFSMFAYSRYSYGASCFFQHMRGLLNTIRSCHRPVFVWTRRTLVEKWRFLLGYKKPASVRWPLLWDCKIFPFKQIRLLFVKLTSSAKDWVLVV